MSEVTLLEQLPLWEPAPWPPPEYGQPVLNSYDVIIVYFSGGKDSLSCILHLLEQGVDPERIELWHHEIDGRENDGRGLMDWPITPDYCRAIAGHLGIPIYFSWKVGGFEREMLRDESRTAPTRFETPDGEVRQIGGIGGRLGTRLQFPQVSADLRVRWCSAYLKIDVAAAAIRNQDRFLGKRVLTISGERAEESPARAHYRTFEPDRADNRDGKSRRRHVDRWRPVHAWSNQDVWNIIGRWRINPHPAYHLGWGRVSCMFCIFGSDSQWATLDAIDPAGTSQLIKLEQRFGKTIHRTLSIEERIARGRIYDPVKAPEMHRLIAVALSTTYAEPVYVADWQLPAGAFGESCGPT